jgi:glutamate N-acetyltransferase/amino-acid N-acetyltransferase
LRRNAGGLCFWRLEGTAMIEIIQGGGVTSPKGFVAGATFAGLKTWDEGVRDIGILVSEGPAAVAGTFTTNSVESPSVTLSRERAANGSARGVVANSGCANCCVGEYGLKDAAEMASLAAAHARCEGEELLVCSTGMIGVELPMALIRQNIGNIRLSADGGPDFARAIMTTDTRPKEVAVSADLGGYKVTLGGAAKGVGMIHPNMATMLCFVTTDASVDAGLLRSALKAAVDESLNMIDVDGDQSTNDTVLLLANGAAGGPPVEAGSRAEAAFREGLTYVCTELAKQLVRDGEGAQRLIEVTVDGAASRNDARSAARSVASSLLVKAMVHGRDPNWGRIMMALGKSDAAIEEKKIDIFVNGIHIVHEGQAISFLKDAVISAMSVPDVNFRISLNLGSEMATAWGCDLTEEYATFNSAYST